MEDLLYLLIRIVLCGYFILFCELQSSIIGLFLFCGHFILWAIIQYHCYLFYCSYYSNFHHWDLFQVGSCVLLMCPLSFLRTCLLLWTTRCSKLLLYFSWLSPGINHLSKGPWFLFWRIVFRIQDMGEWFVSLVLGLLSRQSLYICILTNAYTHL